MTASSALGAPAHDRVRLESFLLGEADAPPPTALLRESGLAAYAYTCLGGDAPADLGDAYRTATLRHLAVKAEVARLVRAWQREGVEPLVFKGFYLAEFVYRQPAQRLYSDVDMLLQPRQIDTAARVAQDLGWSERWRAEQPDTVASDRASSYAGHEVMRLVHRLLGIQLDVHRRLVHNNHNRLPFFGKQERITRAAWEGSQRIPWEGTQIRVLRPVDSVLIGLVLNRCWSSDAWALRAHDFLDFRALTTATGLTPEALLSRAQELGCSRTLDLFLRRCDPFLGHLDLKPPSRLDVQRWNAAVTPERGSRPLERSLVAAAELPGAAAVLGRELPQVLTVLLMLRRHREVDAVARRLARPQRARRRPSFLAWRRLKRAVHRSVRLLARDPRERRLLTALSLYGALQRRGCAVTLHHEPAATATEHPTLWLELDGQALNLGGTLLDH